MYVYKVNGTAKTFVRGSSCPPATIDANIIVNNTYVIGRKHINVPVGLVG